MLLTYENINMCGTGSLELFQHGSNFDTISDKQQILGHLLALALTGTSGVWDFNLYDNVRLDKGKEASFKVETRFAPVFDLITTFHLSTRLEHNSFTYNITRENLNYLETFKKARYTIGESCPIVYGVAPLFSQAPLREPSINHPDYHYNQIHSLLESPDRDMSYYALASAYLSSTYFEQYKKALCLGLEKILGPSGVTKVHLTSNEIIHHDSFFEYTNLGNLKLANLPSCEKRLLHILGNILYYKLYRLQCKSNVFMGWCIVPDLYYSLNPLQKNILKEVLLENFPTTLFLNIGKP